MEKIKVTSEQYAEALKWADAKYCLEAVKQNGYALRYVWKQTPEICLEAVKQNGYALQFVHAEFLEVAEDKPLNIKCKLCGK